MIAIKNAVVPPSCYFCPMTNDGLYLCKANNPYKMLEDDCEERRPDWCPLVNVPPHGRLIDADALKDLYHYNTHDSDIDKAWTGNIRRSIDSAPTVLEAEEDE